MEMRNEGPIPSLREKYTTSRGDWSGGTGSSDGDPWGNPNSGVLRGAGRKILHEPLDLAFAKEGCLSKAARILVKTSLNRMGSHYHQTKQSNTNTKYKYKYKTMAPYRLFRGQRHPILV
jgi:hypothetical protein